MKKNYTFFILSLILSFSSASAQNKDQESKITNLIMLADTKYQEQKIDSANELINQALSLIDTVNQRKSLAIAYNLKGMVTGYEGQRTDAMDYFLKAARIFEEMNLEGDLAMVYNNIADLNLSLKYYDSAIYYLLKSEKLNLKLNLERSLIGNYINLGIAYKNLNLLPQAINSFEKCVQISRKLNDEFSLARGFMNMANMYRRQGDNNIAVIYYDSSTLLCEKNNFKVGILLNKMNLGETYISMGNNNRGMKLLLEAHELLNENSSLEQKSELNLMLSEGYKKNGDFKQALTSYQMYTQLKDSIASEETKSYVLGLQLKFDREKSAREIAQLQHKMLAQESRNNQIKLIMFFLFVVLILAVTTFIFSHRASVFKTKLTMEENEKLTMSMELKGKELITNAMQIAQINEQVISANKRLRTLLPELKNENRQVVISAMNDLKNYGTEKAWKEFETRFAQVHEEFYDILLEKYPNLSPSEIRMCSYLKLNLSTKEISLLTNRSSRTIENSRSSIRKKMQLESEDNLVVKLLSLS